MSEPDNAAIISVLEAIADNESIDGFTIRYWANHAKCRIEEQAAEIERLIDQLDRTQGYEADMLERFEREQE